MATGWPHGYINWVDLTEKRRLDAARQQLDKVRTRARSWRSIAAVVLAVITAAVSRSARTDAASAVFSGTPYRALGRTGTEIAADAAAVAFCLLASAATAGLAGKARDGRGRRPARGASRRTG